jgi:intracellular septation protein A
MITLHDYLQAEFEYDVHSEKHGWKIHAVVYGVVMTALVVINLLVISLTDADFVWFPFPLVGWGIGLAMHYLYAVHWIRREVRDHQEKIQDIAEHKVHA